MAGDSTQDGNTGINVSSGSESGVRKFTLSCSRCRASKLKCDRKQPCVECVKRNIGHLCTKDERQPRAKRIKTDHDNGLPNKTNTSYILETEAEETVQALEHFVDGTTRINAYPSAVSNPKICSVAPDYPNMYWAAPNGSERQAERQVESFVLIQEIVDAIPDLDMLHLLYEIFITRCQGPLGNAVHTLTFMKQVEDLCGCLSHTCLSRAKRQEQVLTLFNTFSMETLACHLLALVLGLAFHPTPSLLGWSPTPLALRVEELRASDRHIKRWRSLALRCLQGRLSLFCGSIASLQAALMLLLDAQEGLLTLDIILVTAISGAQKLGLHRLGDAKLETTAPPTPSSEDGSQSTTEATSIRTETGIRIWWALVMRDWSRGQALGYYNISPSQFNTRMPLHINDDDLYWTVSETNVPSPITERPRTEFTMLSYTLHALEIAIFARESIDLRGPLRQIEGQETKEGVQMRNRLNKRYEKFVTELPSYFRLGSTVGLTSTGPMVAIPVQRWMLHQQLWSLLLRLHRANLLSQDGRASCHLLAQNIISTQAQIQARCAVCGSLSISDTQLFNAAIVLVFDLLFSSKRNGVDRSSAQLSRLMTRDKIREAIDLMQIRNDTDGSNCTQAPLSDEQEAPARRSITTLEALMKLDEEEYGNSEENITAIITGNRPGDQRVQSDNSREQTLKQKVMDILKSLQQTTKKSVVATEPINFNLDSAFDISMPLPTTTEGWQDLDVLPVLSNDPSCDIGQFFDWALPSQTPTENDYLPATTDLQNSVESMPFRPPSDIAHSLSSFGTPDLADSFGNE